MTLTEFLLARIAEDEGTALYAQIRDDVQPEDWGGWWFGHHQHYSRHNPARVLAECEAKRRIIALAGQATELDVSLDHEFRVGVRDLSEEPYCGDQILYALALPYASHPDYREEW